MVSGVVNTLELPVSEEQLELYYSQGLLVQDAFPNLSPSEREFVKTGITPEEWEKLFAGEEE